MFKRILDGLEEGRRRYGAKNANPTCARCGAGLGPGGALGVEHGGEKYCTDCAVTKGFIDKKDVENTNTHKCPNCGESAVAIGAGTPQRWRCASCDHEFTTETRNDRDMGEYSKCAACSHEKALHTEGDGKCYACGCADFKNTLKNDAPPLPGPNLGYEYGTTTTTSTPGSACKECGHALSQKFYDTNCQCRCHTELDNTVCDICRQEEGAGLEEHLMTRHGLEAEVAIVVAADMEKVRA